MTTSTSFSLCTTGPYYQMLLNKNQYSSELQNCIQETVTHLREMPSNSNRPGMLLGKIQSGKTRAFIGIMSLAFDNSFDVTIILTKGTVALAEQTYQRLSQEFHEFIQEDKAQIFDIMNYPGNLRKYELRQKLVFVVKKQKQNLERLHDAFFIQTPELANKKVLIIDDEADFASIGFEKTKDEVLKIRRIADQIDTLRKGLTNSYFLQVTATPYSLYLQPEDLMISENKTFVPTQPAFTVLVPIHDRYIGGDFYFRDSLDENHIARFLYEEVNPKELQVLKKSDRRTFKIEDVLTSKQVKSLRNAVVNFVVGGCVRRIQNRKAGLVEKKYSFIVHTEQSKNAHSWQEEIVIELEQQLIHAATNRLPILNELVDTSFQNLKKSIQLFDDFYLPTLDEVMTEVIQALVDEFLMVIKVNSEKTVSELLDDSGQLKLRSPLNIFIGGQILDRGITIGNLIGFYYGRNPKKFQQDTVLQHSRMYGARPFEDLTVTRFYTTQPIYNVMRKIHEFDAGLREAFELGSQNNGVVFIQKDLANQIVPCSPNKIMLSKVTTLKPFKRLLPVGFQTLHKTKMKNILSQLDTLIFSNRPTNRPEDAFLVELSMAKQIIELITSTLEFEDGYEWDEKAFISSLEYLSSNSNSANHTNKVWLVVRENRRASRLDMNGKFENAPDTPKGPKGELRVAREAAKDIPALILLRQEGRELEEGWRGTPFWWPVLVAPQNTKTVVFTSKTVE